MAALTGAMLALTAAQTIGQVAGQRQQASAIQQQGAFAGAQADRNAKLADAQAADATARGQQSATRAIAQGRQVVGAQRTGYAGQGVDVGSGTAASLQAETRGLSSLDALTIQNNAAREAWGYSVQAGDYRDQGALARSSANNQARALRGQGFWTLVNGAASMYNTWATRPQLNTRAPQPNDAAVGRTVARFGRAGGGGY